MFWHIHNTVTVELKKRVTIFHKAKHGLLESHTKICFYCNLLSETFEI